LRNRIFPEDPRGLGAPVGVHGGSGPEGPSRGLGGGGSDPEGPSRGLGGGGSGPEGPSRGLGWIRSRGPL